MVKLVIDKFNSQFIYKEGKDQKGLDALTPFICPYTPPLLVPNPVANKIQEKNRQCGSWCPLFEYVEASNDTGNDAVTLYCGNGRKIPVEVTKDKPIAEA